MKETVEHNNRFYKQPNGEMLTENEQLKEWLVIANKHNEELQKERDMYKTSFETMSTNYFRLENIIKEVRDILRKHICNPSGLKKGWRIDCWNNEDISKLNEDLGILDKEVD